MNSRYRFIEHTADLEFEAYGATLNECFENAALALFFSITDLSAIIPVEKKTINLREDEIDILLHEWLSELLYIFESEQILLHKFKVIVDEKNKRISAIAYGERFDPKKHKLKTDIKAVTYHNLSLNKVDGKWVAHVICDI